MVRSGIERRGAARQIVLVGVLVLLAVAVGWLWFGRAPAEPSVDESRAAAEHFLEQIRNGKAAMAWESTTSEFKSYEGRETFLKNIKTRPLLTKPLKFVSVQTVTVQKSPRAECIFRAADGSGTAHLLVGNEQGQWRIDRVTTE